VKPDIFDVKKANAEKAKNEFDLAFEKMF